MANVRREADPLDRAALLHQLWLTLPAPLATELGAIGALLLPAYAAIGIALLALALLALALRVVEPGTSVVSAVVLVAGPPLRYLLVLVAVWRTLVDPAQGLVPALALVLGLVFAVPMAAFLVAQSRARRP
jgi:hypothetical protein